MCLFCTPFYLELTTFSKWQIFFSWSWICWFFISRTSFRLFRSSSICWYGANASCKYIYSTYFQCLCAYMIVSLFKCLKRNIPRFVHQCSSSGPLQNAWLCLSEFGSGKSECPPGPEGNGTVTKEVPWMSSKKSQTLSHWANHLKREAQFLKVFF